MEKNRRNMDSRDYHVGIDAGSVSLNCAVINENKDLVYETPYRRHLGKVEEGVVDLVQALFETLGKDKIRSISFTGNHGKTLSEKLETFYEFETISQVLGALFIRPDLRRSSVWEDRKPPLCRSIHDEGGWGLEYFNTNGPCASGTGSFIDQQAERLATAMYESMEGSFTGQDDRILADFIALGLRSRKPANVACRCTVFTKSDMIHLQNKGEGLEDIIHGLHVGNARNYMSTIVSNRDLEAPIVFIGGVSLNALQVKAFKDYFPGLVVPPHSTSFGALGVALQALESKRNDQLVLERLTAKDTDQTVSVPVAERLVMKETGISES